jgi:tetratricopeptide (TPR) repeat protein
VISGTAGVGKTALAVHWARRAAERFPDGQLHVDLRGFDPARAPLDPGEVLRGFLDALGLHAHRIPRGFDAQLGLYRSVLAGKRVLISLDNARDADQVRPLLPGSPGCVTVATSRAQLTPLVATQGARPLTLDLLTPEESRDLLGRRLGASGVAAEPAAAEQIISRCAGLPLALAIVAAQASTTAMPLSVLAEQLQDSAGPLDTLTAGDQSTDLRAVFSWSTSALTPQAAGLYRLLGLHPGPDLTAAAAASLTGKPLQWIRPGLGELVRASLLTEHTPGRFTSHDLLRAYAAEQARDRCTGQDQDAATHRMLDHYLHSAQEAARLIHGPWNHVSLASAQPGVTAERFADEPQATAWLHAEYQVLLSSIEYAASAGFGTHAWQLAFSMGTFFERSGHWRDWARVVRVALTTAQRAGDTSGQAHARQQLGVALTYLGDYEQACSELQTAIDMFGFLGDDAHRAQVHLSFGYLCDCQDSDEQALDHSQQALKLFRSAGHHAGEAVALSNIGWSQAQQGHYAEALLHCRRALGLFQQAEDHQGQASAWDGLGYIHDCRADHAEAIACYIKSAEFFRQIRDSFNQATTLTRLGDVYRGDLARDICLYRPVGQAFMLSQPIGKDDYGTRRRWLCCGERLMTCARKRRS